jgi:hypothetical protein
MNASILVFVITAVLSSVCLLSCREGWTHRRTVVEATWRALSPSSDNPRLDRIQLDFPRSPGTQIEVYGENLRRELEHAGKSIIDVTFDVWGPDKHRCTGFNVVGISDLPVQKLTTGTLQVTSIGNSRSRDICDLVSGE